MAFKSTHVDWFDDGSSAIHHKGDEDVKHGASNTDGVLVSISKHIGGVGFPPRDRWGEKITVHGTNCDTCEYLNRDTMKDCKNENFIAWEGPEKPAGSSKIPGGDPKKYCSIWWEEE